MRLLHRTSSYVQDASQLYGFAASQAVTNQRRAFELFGDEAGYEFLFLAGESYGRFDEEAAGFLFNRCEVAFSISCASKSTFRRTV